MLSVERRSSAQLARPAWEAIIGLCDAAYGESTREYFAAIGPGDHLLGYLGGALVSHLMWVPRQLHVGGGPVLHSAYIEMVATGPAHQGRGFASTLLQQVPGQVAEFELAALSPATEPLYLRLGWSWWLGPLSTRRGDQVTPDPDERIMVQRTPRTPPGLDLHLPLSVDWRPGEVW
jgi:GNAT superfamily N-acetyltransferase